MSDASPPDGPPASRLDKLPVSLRWVIYVFGVVAGGAGVAATIEPLLTGKLSGVWLLVLFALELILFGLVVWLLASHFNRLFSRFLNETESLRKQVTATVAEARSVDFTLAVARRLNDDIATLNRQELAPKDVLLFIQKACDGLRDAYDHGAGLQTRVCVKQVGAGLDEPPYVTDVYRTNEPVDHSVAAHHSVDGNTDFRQLVRREKKYWFTGHRSSYPDYVTTSVNPKYESVIVWPIIPRVPSDGDVAGLPIERIRAFLCLDSEVPHAFSETRDVALGWMVADALARAYENARD